TISILPIILAATYQVGLTATGETPILGIHLIELSFSIIVFLVFDLKEKSYLLPILIINALIIASYPYTVGWWEPTIDAAIIREGYIGILALCIGIFFTFANVFVLVQQNLLSENKTAQLLSEAQETNEKAKQSEQELKQSLKQLEHAQNEEKQRQWVSEGLAQTVGILREHNDMQHMGDRIIAHIVRYMQANQGGLFIVNKIDDKKCLSLLACYAYERKKFAEKTVAIGEGLIGQTYLEKKYVYLTNIPKNYINITSGLGKTTPGALLIMPLIINEEVEGVLELASFREFQPYEIDFIQTLSENIAATLRNGRVSAQTKVLLEESQQQAEEMQAQEEEMRQNMEELQATQEQSERFKTELEESQSILKEKLLQLEAAQLKAEEVSRIEKQRADEQIQARTKMMEKAMTKFKQREQELNERIQEQDKEIEELSKS
ncbi:MAG: GAF domain-containing protein, partial [Tunicatimonas sp.]|uniref:GAF domain-containing protein n=1 Tax=Tunicatimonas sp. TaxID=1940096 RepID=UPI003C74F404